METKEFIHEKMISYFETASSGRFGRLEIINLNSIFNDKIKDIINYLENDPIMIIDSHLSKDKVYASMEGLHQIKDKELKSKCNQAWINNQNRINSINLY